MCRLWINTAIFTAVISLLFVRQTLAADDLWTNPAGGAWATNSNWSQNTPPAAYDAVFNLGSTTGYTVTGGGAAEAFTVETDMVNLDLTGSFLSIFNSGAADRLQIATSAGQNGALSIKGSGSEVVNVNSGTLVGLNGGNGSLSLDDVVYQDAHLSTMMLGDSSASVASLVLKNDASLSGGGLVVSPNSSVSLDNSTTLQTPYQINGSLTANNQSSIGDSGSDLAVYASSPATASATIDNSTVTLNNLIAGGGAAGVFSFISGQGSFTAQNGSAISVVNILVGDSAGAVGMMAVSGAATTVTTANNATSFVVGDAGTGSATFSGGAHLNTGSAYVGGNAGNGSVKLSGAGTTWAMSLTNSNAFIGVDSANALGTGLVQLDNAAAWTITNLIPALSRLTVASDGTLKILSQATVSTPNFTMQPGATLELGLGAADGGLNPTIPLLGPSGELTITSTATFASTLDISLGNGFIPSVGESFKLLNFTSETGQFSSINFPAGYSFDTSALYTTGTITTTAIPEPLSFGLAAVIAAGSFRRKRS